MSLATEIDTVQLSLFSPGYFFLMLYPGMLAMPVAFALRIARPQSLLGMPSASSPKESAEASAEQRLSRDAIKKMLLFIVKKIVARILLTTKSE